jgi:hypothetical protein
VSKHLDAALAVATLLALAGAGLWLLDGWITRQAWAAWNGQKWAVVATGWSLAFHAWPVALAAATALLGAFCPILAVFAQPLEKVKLA